MLAQGSLQKQKPDVQCFLVMMTLALLTLFEDYILLQIKVSGCGVRGQQVAGSQTFGSRREGLEESCGGS